jgi:hypothetical protein
MKNIPWRVAHRGLRAGVTNYLHRKLAQALLVTAILAPANTEVIHSPMKTAP